MGVEIYIGGLAMELGEDAFNIAKTKQAFTFLNLGASVRTDRTNRLNLPATANNLSNLNLLGIIQRVNPIKVYENLNIDIIVDGVTSKPAVCQIVSFEEDITIDVQGSIKNFFNAIDGLFLNDLDFSAVNRVWDNAAHDTARQGINANIKAPLVDCGQMLDVAGYVDNYTHGIAVLPFFDYSYIMNKIFDKVGYTKIGAVFSDTNVYQKLMLNPRLVYTQVHQDEISVVIPTTDVTTPSTGNTPMMMTATGQNSKLTWTGANQGVYARQILVTGTAPLCAYKVVFSAKISLVAGSLANLLGRIRKNNVVISTTAVFTTDLVTITVASLELSEKTSGIDTEITVDFANNDAVSRIAISRGTLTFEAINTTDIAVVQKQTWHWEFQHLMPRIELRDFIRDFMRMFGLVIREEKRNEIEFKYIKDILQSTGADVGIVLTRRNATRRPKVTFTPNGFAQLNVYKWIVQADSTINEDYARGTKVITNNILPRELTIYQSIYTASDSVSNIKITDMASIVIYNNGTSLFTKAASMGTRLLLRRDEAAPVRYVSGGATRTDGCVGYFYDLNQTYNLTWQYFLNTYYAEYFDMLNNYVAVEDQFLISDTEFKLLDMFKLHIIDGTLYVLESVTDHVSNNFANFKLIKR